MPRKGTSPELDEYARAVSERATRGPAPAILHRPKHIQLLLDLPAVRDLAEDDNLYSRAVALEQVLQSVVSNLDESFPYRRGEESPTWIGRCIFSIDPAHASKSAQQRRMAVARKYGWGESGEGLRSHYLPRLYLHIARLLRTYQSQPPLRQDKTSIDSTPLPFQDWLDRVRSGTETFYEKLDRGLHEPPLHDNATGVSSVSLLVAYVGLRSAYLLPHKEADNPQVAAVNRLMYKLQEVSPFTHRDDARLVEEYRDSSTDFVDFLDDTMRGDKLLGHWNKWLDTCRCMLHPASPPEQAKPWCTVHRAVRALEEALSNFDHPFRPGWQVRADNSWLIQQWESTRQVWFTLDIEERMKTASVDKQAESGVQ
ncbi:MAG: hypothetical protein ACTHLH_08540 [Solirubrobacterales bacterium]